MNSEWRVPGVTNDFRGVLRVGAAPEGILGGVGVCARISRLCLRPVRGVFALFRTR